MQTQKRSLLEVICNTGSGVLCAYLAWVYIVLPWRDMLQVDLVHMDALSIVLMNGVFTIVSVVRGYLWRRLFNKYD